MYTPGIIDQDQPAAPTYQPSTGEPWSQPPQLTYSPVPQPGAAPRSPARAATVLGVTSTVLAVAAYVGWQAYRAYDDTSETIAQTITDSVFGDDSGDGTDVLSLAVGDCLSALPTGGTVTEAPTVPCAQPHVYEVYSAADVPDSAYPGDTALIGAADAQCLAAFEPFAGIDYVQSVLFYSYLYPTEESWAAGDRAVVCMVFDSSATTVTGSLAGAAR